MHDYGVNLSNGEMIVSAHGNAHTENRQNAVHALADDVALSPYHVQHGNDSEDMDHEMLNRIPGMVAYMRPFSVPATAGTLASTYVRGGMVCL